jgi:hypothetical protein
MVDNLGIDDAVTWLTLLLFLAAFLMIFSIVHEVLPFLNEDDRVRIKEWYRSGGHGRINEALRGAWREHYEVVPPLVEPEEGSSGSRPRLG